MSLLERALDDGRIHPRRLALAPSLICLGISAQANANPIVVTGSEYGILKSDENLIYNYALIVIAALSVEYLSFRWFFRKRLRFRPALACFLGIHAISWPLTQVVSVFIGLLSFDLIPVTEIEGKEPDEDGHQDRKSTRLNSSHGYISYAVFCLKKKNNE